MTAKYIGGVSIGEALPVVPITLAQMQSLMAPQLAKRGDMAARLGMPFVPPNPAIMLAALQAQLASLASTLAQLPGLDAKARASIGVELGLVDALLAPAKALIANVGGAVSTGGFHLYALDGKAGSIGSDLAAATSGGFPLGGGATAPAKALVIATESPTAWKALGTFVRTG